MKANIRLELSKRRSQTTGRVKKTTPTTYRGAKAPAVVQEPPAREAEGEADEEEEQRQYQQEQEERQMKKIRAKEDAFVVKKLEAERNRRLRLGTPLSRDERATLELRFRAAAEEKYRNGGTSRVDRSTAEDAQQQEKADEMDARRKAVLERQAAELHRAREEAAREEAMAAELESQADNDGQQSQWEQQGGGNYGGSEGYSAEAPGAQYGGGDGETPRGAEGGQGPQSGEDQAWWAAEEAKWKAELHSQQTREGMEPDDAARRELLPQFDAAAGESEDADTVNLRTYRIVKATPSEALGVQFYTPPDGLGVRITAISISGPFGRCGNIMDDDVLVEVNGKPVLYAGHAGVIACVKAAMSGATEMTVTVCRPAELAKLTAAKASAATNGKGGFTALGDRDEGPKPTSGIGRWFAKTKSMFKKSPARNDATPEKLTPAESPSGKMTGAPQWWYEQDSKKAKMAARGETPKKDVKMSPGGTQQQVPTASNVGAASPGRLSNGSPPAYLIYRADVRDLEAYKTNYMSKTTELITQFGGRWLARGGKISTLEGSEDAEEQVVLQRMVLIEFPTMDAAKAFFHSEEYQVARLERLSIATAELTVLEGMVDLVGITA